MYVHCNPHIYIFSRPTGSEMKSVSLVGDKPHDPDHVGGYSVSLPIFSGIESKFGICLPKFTSQQSSWTTHFVLADPNELSAFIV